jgi:iron complex outermembrane receptor protein
VQGAGYYENYRFNNKYSSFGLPNVVVGANTITRSDFIRQLWLDNDFYGQLVSLHYKKNKHAVTLGGGWNTYVGEHFGKLIWAKDGGVNPDAKFYNTPALKKDVNIYAKWEYPVSNNWQLFTDLQYRNVAYKMNGFRNNPTLFINRTFGFLNPKIGVTYTKSNWKLFGSYALANKEPNRDDFEASTTTQPLHETLHNIELGAEKRTKNWLFAANFYYMYYKNQLVNTGKINDVGAYTRVNVPSSYRMGIELQANGQFSKWLKLNSNISISKNKINAFAEFIDDYDLGGQLVVQHSNTDIALSPNVVGSASLDFVVNKQVEISAISKYVGKQYLDNTQNQNKSLDAFYTQDIRLQWTPSLKCFSHATIILQASNVFNKLYEPNGYTFSYKAGGVVSTENYFFPMASTNFMLGVNVRL